LQLQTWSTIGGTRTDQTGLRTRGRGDENKPAGAAAEEGKSCRGGGTVLKKQINSTIMGLFQNGVASLLS